MRWSVLTFAAAVGLASGANALSLTIDSEKATYGVGETITLTATLDTTGAVCCIPENHLVAVWISWNDPNADALGATATFTNGTSTQVITVGFNVGESNLTSFDGAAPWVGPAQSGCDLTGPGAGNTCILLNQNSLAGPLAPDPATLVGTLQADRGRRWLTRLQRVGECVRCRPGTGDELPERPGRAGAGVGGAGRSRAGGSRRGASGSRTLKPRLAAVASVDSSAALVIAVSATLARRCRPTPSRACCSPGSSPA